MNNLNVPDIRDTATWYQVLLLSVIAANQIVNVLIVPF
jgi:hypothetical protein